MESSKMKRENNYLNLITRYEKMSDFRTRYFVGDNFIIDISKCEHDLTSSTDLMRLWKKAGYIEEMLPTHIVVETFFTDASGDCWGYYNPTIKASADGKRRVLNFDYLLEYTPDNVAHLLNEAIRMREIDNSVLTKV